VCSLGQRGAAPALIAFTHSTKIRPGLSSRGHHPCTLTCSTFVLEHQAAPIRSRAFGTAGGRWSRFLQQADTNAVRLLGLEGR